MNTDRPQNKWRELYYESLSRAAGLEAVVRECREIARDDGREIDTAAALGDVFSACDMALDPDNYID